HRLDCTDTRSELRSTGGQAGAQIRQGAARGGGAGDRAGTGGAAVRVDPRPRAPGGARARRARDARGRRGGGAAGEDATREPLGGCPPGPRELFEPPRGSESPLAEMTEGERLVADYAGTGVTLGRHPMAMRRAELRRRGVLSARELGGAANETRVRVAGSVIVRQRPGTAKGFVFLSLEDETGIANVIVTPQRFARHRLTLVTEPFLLVEGIVQQQDGVVSVRATRVEGLSPLAHNVPSHDFG